MVERVAHTDILRVLGIVEYSLRLAFPHDFFRRCAFAAVATRALLNDMGVQATMIGGEFAALVVSRDSVRSGVQGFRAEDRPFAHFWVEADDRLIDLGPHLLAFGSSYAALPMPALAWNLAVPLPVAIRYRAKQRVPEDEPMTANPRLAAMYADFVARCRAVARDGPTPQLTTWTATSYASLLAAIDAGDAWAGEAKRFEQSATQQALPF